MVQGILVYSVLNILISSWFVYRFMNITLMEQIKQVHIVALNALIPIIACVIWSSLVDDLYSRFALCFVSYFVIYGLLGLLVKDKAIDFLMGYFKKGES
jgi:fucose permease